MKKATRRQVKIHNTNLILNTVYHHGPISRADISRATHLTRATVSDIVAKHIEDGLITEDGYGPSKGGKRPILLRLVDDARDLICVDLANREFRGAVVNLRGQVKHRISEPVEGQTGQEALRCAYRLLDALVAAADGPVLGLGVGTAGITDSAEGVIRKAVNFGWENLPARRLLEERYKFPVYVANDAHTAAYAEYAFGFGRTKKLNNLFVVRLGHGIGSGIVINGELFYGDRFAAGEIGHVVVVDNAERCRCGNYGCLETVASNRAIMKRAQKIARAHGDHLDLQPLEDSGTTSLSYALREALQEGNTYVEQAVEEAGHYLGIALANVIGILNIQNVIIVGSMTSLGSRLLDVIQQSLETRTLETTARETTIALSELGQDIVLLGASALVLKNELGIA